MISNAPWTRPGIAALTTGIHPLVLEIDDTGDDVERERGLSPDVLTLGERFSAAGYTTVGATANPNINKRFGFAQGFDQYQDTEAFWREGIVKWSGEDVVDAFLEQASSVEGPLFGQMVLVDAHRPLDWLPLRQARLGIYSWKGGNLVEQYDSELVRLDDALQRLEEGLEELGRSDRLMVVVGDHGEGLNRPKHAGRAHARWLYDANLHVPLIFSGPGVQPGHVVEGVTQSVDLAPTLLGLVGIEGDELLQGRSQLDAIQGERSRTQGDEILSATHYGSVNKARLTTPYWTYIRNFSADHELKRGEHELYNPNDLDQSRDVSKAHPEVIEALSARLQKETELLREDAMRWELEITEENREQLEALGYVD
jgi:arylsulfatase A-like enzyme